MASQQRDLQSVKNTFEEVLDYETLEVEIEVHCRMMGTSFCAEYIVFILKFKKAAHMENLLLIDCMVIIHHALLDMIRRLKTEFDNGMKRFCFFSCSVDQMTSNIYSGMRNLYGETEEVCQYKTFPPKNVNWAIEEELRKEVLNNLTVVLEKS